MNNEEWTYPTGYILTFICVSRGRGVEVLAHTVTSFLSHHRGTSKNHCQFHVNFATHSRGILQHIIPWFHMQSSSILQLQPVLCPFSYWSCILPSVFCPHWKHFCSLLRQDPRIRNINNAVDQTSGNAKNHLESLLNRFLGSTLKFSFTRSEVRAPEFVFVTSSQPVLTLQLVTAGLLWISTALKTTLDPFTSLTWHIFTDLHLPPLSDCRKIWEKGHKSIQFEFSKINTLTSVKLCASLMADILITFPALF